MTKVKMISIPLYYIYGQYDLLYKSDELQKFIMKKFGENHLYKFKESGHTPNIEEPLLYKATLNRILNN